MMVCLLSTLNENHSRALVNLVITPSLQEITQEHALMMVPANPSEMKIDQMGIVHGATQTKKIRFEKNPHIVFQNQRGEDHTDHHFNENLMPELLMMEKGLIFDHLEEMFLSLTKN